MMGESESDDSASWVWAHILWQRHNLRMEEWAEMPREVQLAYIASEQLESEHPQGATKRLAKGFLKKK